MKFIYSGLFLVAGSILMLEIALTRVFAIMMWHHLTYMVVSVAMLGFGAAGSILTATRQGLRSDSPARALALLSFAYGTSTVIAFMIATRVPLDTLGIWQDKANLLLLASIYALIALPFLFGGFAVGLALTRLAANVNRLYFFDLLGSAVGGASSVWLLAHVGAAATVVIAGGIGVLAATAFALATGPRSLWLTGPACVAAGFTCLAFAGGAPGLGLPAIDWWIPYAPGKEFAGIRDRTGIVRQPSATAEVAVAPSGLAPPIMGGNFGRVDRRGVVARFVGQDGTAPTMLYENAADLDSFAFLDDSQPGSAYVALGARGGSAPSVLVIGVGGGVDVMVALAHGARSVTAVEINAAMIDLVTREFDDYLGGLFRERAHPFSDRLELIHGEGRSFVRSSDERFDVIQMSGVDSFTALSTGAYTLSESYLYTTEAVKDFYEHLHEDGYINYSRFILSRPRRPRETLRLANIAWQALSELGVEDPASQILVYQGNDWASTLIKRGPFTQAEVRALAAFAERQGFWGAVFDPLGGDSPAYHPGVVYDEWARMGFEKLADELHGELGSDEQPDGVTRDELVESLRTIYRLRMEGETPAADDGLAALVARLPSGDSATARVEGRVEGAVRGGRAAEDHFEQTRRDFDALLGGSADERRSFLDAYPYDVSASTDDSPFFFNYYKYAGLFESGGDAPTHLYHSDYPVGHVVLLASLLQITTLASVLILLPLRSLARGGISTAGKGSVFAYFTALGAGFMFVEISLMQKMVLFLGHPTYAISVVLVTLLASAGLGSLASDRLGVGSRTLASLLGAILAVVAGVALACEVLLPALLGITFAWRVVVIVALLTPLGLALGMPFPLGIRVVSARAPQLVPWAWAINGFVSVFASIFTIVLSMAVGFFNVLIIAAMTYTLGLIPMIIRLWREGVVSEGAAG